MMRERPQTTVITKMPSEFDRFKFFWQLDAPWFEPPNQRRGGWSGVCKLNLDLDGESATVFIKRQENHQTRTWRHWLSGIPTFEREYLNIKQLEALNIPTLAPVYFARQKDKVILITRALDNFESLDKLDYEQLDTMQKRGLIRALAKTIRKMHDYRLQHNCLYPKHIFVRRKDTKWEIRLIDLEKLRRKVFKRQVMLRDLSCLTRHAPETWSLTDRMRFLKTYLNENRLSARAKNLWRQIATKSARKRR